MKKFIKLGIAAALIAPLHAMAVPTVNWTSWSSSSTGTSAQNAQSINVSYSGDTIGLDHNAYIYDVPSSFTSAEVTNTPGNLGTILMQGGNATINTFHFSHAVVNPYIALFSVGQDSVPVSFNFLNGASFSVLSQGAGHWAGGSLTALPGNTTIVGREGNGVLKFNGTFTDISFTTPNSEYYYGATIGLANVAAVPEPSNYAMLLAGLAGLGLVLRRRRRP
ncbi:hypothetical protein AAKU55_004244 [Oxalobacteraceae bacterium GrIS 1.11]